MRDPVQREIGTWRGGIYNVAGLLGGRASLETDHLETWTDPRQTAWRLQ